MSKKAQPRVALLGSGQQADEWSEALSRVARVQTDIVSPVDALVIAPGAHDPVGPVRDALREGVPVLFAASFQL